MLLKIWVGSLVRNSSPLSVHGGGLEESALRFTWHCKSQHQQKEGVLCFPYRMFMDVPQLKPSHAKTTRFEGRIKSVSGEKLAESTHAVRIQQMLLCIIQGDFGGNRFPQKTCSTRNWFFATACVDTNGCGRSGRYLREIATRWGSYQLQMGLQTPNLWLHKW